MKKIAITLMLVSGLYLGKSKAEGVGASGTTPDSSTSSMVCLDLDEVSFEVTEVADALLQYSPMTAEDQQTSDTFSMELISASAARDAEEIQTNIEQ